jgi:acyl-coenzyme A thioesterase PaaI-like protein
MVKTLKKWWRRLSSTRLGRWLFSKALGVLIPYTGTIDPRVLELAPGLARVSIKDSRGKRNHLRSVHALALANLGELTTGLCLHFTLEEGGEAILTELRAEYLKKARGPIIAKATLKELPKQSDTVLITAELRDQKSELVANVHASWRIRYRNISL